MRDSHAVKGRIIDAADEHGLTGVVVSSGESVTTTGPDGSFSMEIRPEVDRHLFVTVPAGYRPGDDFYRTISDPGFIDGDAVFLLEPFSPSSCERFTCAHITDLHVGLKGGTTTPPETLCADFADVMHDSSPNFVVASGDVTQWGTPDQLKAVADCAGTLPCPWFPLYGAHDGQYERMCGTTREEMDELKLLGKFREIRGRIPARAEKVSWTQEFEKVFGPPWYSFDWGRWHFALFPNEVVHSTVDDARKKRWLRADLARHAGERSLAVVVHVPPPPDELDYLEQAGVKLVLHGHWHSSKVFQWGGMTVAAAPPLCFGGLDTSPRGYYRIDFEGDSFRIERRILVAAGIRTTGPGVREPRWTCRLPGHMHRAAPVRSGNDILASVQNPRHPGESGVACVDGGVGTVRWFFGMESAVPNRVALDAAGSRAVVVSLTGEVFALDTATGSPCWKARLPDHPYRWACAAPLVVGDRVIAGGRAGYGCWELGSGHQRWYHKIADEDRWPSFLGPVSWLGIVIFAAGNKKLEAVDLESGRHVWSRPLGLSQRYGSPVVLGDRVITGGDCNDAYAPGEEPTGLAVLDAATGDEIWNRHVLEARYPTGLAATGDLIFVSTPHGEVQAFDMETSALRWRHSFSASHLDATPYRRDISAVFAEPLVADEELIVGGCDGIVAVLDTASGEVRKEYALGSAITAPACLLGDGFCAGTFDGRLFHFGP